MQLIKPEPSTESIARFQSLQVGQYWRALSDINDQGIDAGTVLLIQSIRCVDNAPHTVILRPHPSKFGKSVYLSIRQDDGSVREKYFAYSEHRLLLNDFLSLFEFEPDHQRIRSTELAEVQSRIGELQKELVETQVDPVRMAQIVHDGFNDVQADDNSAALDNGDETANEQSALPVVAHAPDAAVVALVAGSVAGAMGSGITVERIEAMKLAAHREKQVATIKAKWIQGMTTEIAKAIGQMTPYYEEQAAAALAQTEDVRNYVDRLMMGIESLDLYVGKNVDVMTIREGAPAERDVPLTLVQRKLMMDEELAAWTDINEWFDFEDHDLFFDALRKHDGLINQIFPTERCVLVMATTRRFIDYGDSWANMTRNDKNEVVFLLVRNGMNIHRVYSPVETHLGSARLFPTQQDQDNVFRGLDGSNINFEDVAYTDRLKAHELFALHYKRFLILACGLDHRLKLFGDFYDGPASLDFVSLSFQERYCRFLCDDDASAMLPGEGRPTVQEWIASKNAFLRSGSRVLCKWDELMNPDTAPGVCKPNNRSYGRGYDRRYHTNEATSVAIAYKDGKSFCVDVEVSGYSHTTHAHRTFSCKVNLSRLNDSRWDHVDLPFLCLDAVDPADLHWYIHHRNSRTNHLDYIRFFKLAMAFIQSERDDELDSRERLMDALAVGNVGHPVDRPAIVDNAVVAWRAANRGKPLPKFDGGAAPAAWKSLLDQMFMLAGEGERRIGDIASFVTGLGLTPLRLVLSGGAKLVMYAAPEPRECDDRLEPHAWVHRLTIERNKSGYTEKSRRWASLPRHAASETTLHQWEGADAWSSRISAFSSFERKQEVMASVATFSDHLKPFTSTMTEEELRFQFASWSTTRNELLEKSSYIQTVSLAVPIGLVYYPRKQLLRYICVGTSRPQVLLARLAPDEAAVNRIRAAYVRPFRYEDMHKKEFDKALPGSLHRWALLTKPVPLTDRNSSIFGGDEIATMKGQPHGPLLSEWFSMWQDKHKDSALVWFADGVLDAGGRLAIDGLLGNRTNDDFELLRARRFQLSSPTPLPKYHHWIDICPMKPDDDLNDSFWPSAAKSDFQVLIDSVAQGDDVGYSSSSDVFWSRADARRHVTGYGLPQLIAVRSTDLHDAPQPPDGIERWYLVEDPQR